MKICNIFFFFFWQGRVIRTKSVTYMPFFISLAYFCNGVIWVIYAILKLDVFILVINSID